MRFSVSKDTIRVLQNFATINKSIVINPGNTISTLSVNKNIYAKTQVPETFDTQIAIYDLPQFLGGLTLFRDPEFDTGNESKLTVVDAETNAKSVFYYADPSVITTPPDKDLVLPSKDVNFVLTDETLYRIHKASAVYQVNDLCVRADGKEVSLVVTDKKNTTSNAYSVPLGETDEVFCHCFKVENLKIISDNYSVVISATATAAEFRSQTTSLCYWIALEPNDD